ncbi:MAG: glutathione S-transferase family protein [Deltaproteobacteria bacterium]|nr:glutathione S-transferase family protein [Deltaproteobacteria bacterium]
MKLYARRTSSNCQKVLWFLGEFGVDYELVATGGDAGGLDAPSYRALNPNGRVPTLVDGDVAIWESHTILRYLAAKLAPERFWVSDPAERSRFERWMDWSQAQLDAAFMDLFWGHWRTPAAQRNVAQNGLLLARCRHYMRILDRALAGRRFLLGDALSLADVPVGALMYRYTNLDVTDELLPNVARGYAALCEREPFRTHVMLPFDELKGCLAY